MELSGMRETKGDLDFAEWQLHAGWKPLGQLNWHQTHAFGQLHWAHSQWHPEDNSPQSIEDISGENHITKRICLVTFIFIMIRYHSNRWLSCNSCISSFWMSDILGHCKAPYVCVTKTKVGLSLNLDVLNVLILNWIPPLKVGEISIAF